MLAVWLKALLLCWLLCVGHAARKSRPCPCEKCDGRVRDYRTWNKHANEIAQGSRLRALGPGFNTPALLDNKLVPDAPDALPAAAQYSMEMVELVAEGTVTKTAMNTILQSTSKHYGEHLPDEVQIPTSWYKAEKIGTDGAKPHWFRRDFCPKCDHLFSVDEHDNVCPKCKKQTRYDAAGKAQRYAYYQTLSDKVKRVFQAKFTAAQIFPIAR
jgi:hypothetical protein